jgi:predicted nucleic acid-binding protein
MDFLDTNVIIRYLTQDHPQQAQQAYQYLQLLGTESVTARTSEGVLVEVVQVLSSKVLYDLPRADIQRLLSPIIRLPGLKLPYKRTYLGALNLYVQYPFLDFVDALNVAHMQRLKIPIITSFDRDFDRVPGITRQEP